MTVSTAIQSVTVSVVAQSQYQDSVLTAQTTQVTRIITNLQSMTNSMISTSKELENANKWGEGESPTLVYPVRGWHMGKAESNTNNKNGIRVRRNKLNPKKKRDF